MSFAGALPDHTGVLTAPQPLNGFEGAIRSRKEHENGKRRNNEREEEGITSKEKMKKTTHFATSIYVLNQRFKGCQKDVI